VDPIRSDFGSNSMVPGDLPEKEPEESGEFVRYQG
jgi:hypothetical protein